MALQKLSFKPGINREVTRYTNENGWYECDKVRFRAGFPEKIGGWQRVSANTYLGVGRSLQNFVTLAGINLVSVGTNLKFYLEEGGVYKDITPIRATTAAGDVTFSATNGSSTLTITDVGHAVEVTDFVTFSGAVTLGGNITANVLNQNYQVVSVPSVDTYTITAKNTAGSTVTANASDTGNGGSSVVGAYEIHTGEAIAIPLVGWSAGAWGVGVWGVGATSVKQLRIWSQSNFGEDLIFGPRNGSIFYWDASNGVDTRAVYLNSLAGASNVPVVQNTILVSDTSRFVFCLGTNNLGETAMDPMLVRWSDQEDPTNWTPAATNQAGSIRLSKGTEIVTAVQSRQEILIWTDSSLYSFQYQGAPIVWGTQLVADNISITSQNCVVIANGVAFWMGREKFYMYDGRTQTLPCAVRRYVFNDFNVLQSSQIFAGTNEAFHEVWWFYCSANSTTIDRYVVYNYVEQTWYYGTLARSAWIDSGLRNFPIAATYSNNLTEHEVGVDDKETATTTAISATITSGQFDIEDGDRLAFIWRLMPDITFVGSSAAAPQATMSLLPLANSGSGYNNPLSESSTNQGAVTRTATVPVEEFTQQVNVRVRGRQMSIQISSDALGVTWQLGSPRIDLRPDGRR
jgi:hypothetical protein